VAYLLPLHFFYALTCCFYNILQKVCKSFVSLKRNIFHNGFSIGFHHSSSLFNKPISIISCFKNPYTDSIFAEINSFKLAINFINILRFIYLNTLHYLFPNNNCPYYISGTERTEWYPSSDNQPATTLSKTFLDRNLFGFVNHVPKIGNVVYLHAVNTP
jgi:hypothetical protein